MVFPALVAFHSSLFGEHYTTYKVFKAQEELDEYLAIPREGSKHYEAIDWKRLYFNNFPLPISDFLILLKGEL